MGRNAGEFDITAILAIDAAWTPTHPSGVALVLEEKKIWRCVAVAPSYDEFILQSTGGRTDWSSKRFHGSKPDVPLLLQAAQALANAPIDLVTVDMPLSITPFSTRRAADNAVSVEFGSRWCAAHSPIETRPGPLGMQLSLDFNTAGYPLATMRSRSVPCLIEVYPHPALLSLLKRSRRVPYKASKASKYWPEMNASGRVDSLLSEYRAIHAALSKTFGPIDIDLPCARNIRTPANLKRYEDALDALVCAWVGVEYLAGRTVALGDETSAIWCPTDVVFAGSLKRKGG